MRSSAWGAELRTSSRNNPAGDRTHETERGTVTWRGKRDSKQRHASLDRVRPEMRFGAWVRNRARRAHYGTVGNALTSPLVQHGVR